MTEVPDIPLDQIQQRVVAMWMGSFYGSSGYVARKLGKKGLREFQDIGARQVAATFKQLGLDEPESVAMAIATNDKNLFGSQVEVAEGDGFVEIRRLRCGQMEGVSGYRSPPGCGHLQAAGPGRAGERCHGHSHQ